MVKLTLELPDSLAQQMETEEIDERDAKAVALAALEIWLTYRKQPKPIELERNNRFEQSAVPFVKHLIHQNRELFETLAHR